MSARTMAIIRNPHFGVGDRGTVALRFDTFVDESGAALQVFGPEVGCAIIAAYGVRDVSDLEGKPCWVDTASKPGMILWLGAWKP